MTKKTMTCLLVCAFALLLSACGSFGDKPPEYLASEEGRPLVIPEGLDQPRPVNPVTIRVEEMRSPSGDELNPLPPRAASTAGGGDANAYLAWSAAGAYLAVKDTPESVSRRLRFAIERSGMKLLERDDNAGHLFEYVHTQQPVEKGFFAKMLFWREEYGPNYSGSYRVRLEGDGKETRVYLLTAAGESVGTNAAEQILGLFMERLG